MPLLAATLCLLSPALPGDLFRPAPVGSVHIEGPLGRRMDRCVQKQLLGIPIENLVRPFRLQNEVSDADWRGEYWGKTVAALALVGDRPDARKRLSRLTTSLLNTADADGRITTYAPENRLKGWDIWGRKYVLLGLVASYDVTHDAETLKAAEKELELLANEVASGKANLAEMGYAEWQGLPPSSILEAVCLVYQRSHNPKALAFARQIVDSWNRPNKLTKTGLRLVEYANLGVRPSDIGSAKAYEQMSCYEGICEMYRCTGDRSFLTAAIRLGDGLLRDEINVAGTGSNEERWQMGRTKQTQPLNKPAETCVTVTWMKLCYQLLRLTGNPKYADALETSLNNALLGAMMPSDRWWSYFTSLQGERVPSQVQHSDVGLSCCAASGPRGLLLASEWAGMNSGEGPVINLYNSSQIGLCSPDGQSVQFKIAGSYPDSQDVTIRLNQSKPERYSLRLRIPAWSARTKLTVNGKSIPCQAGSYAKLTRTWSRKDRIHLRFDLRGRVLHAPDGNGQIAIARGPVLFALNQDLIGRTKEVVRLPEARTVHFEPIPGLPNDFLAVFSNGVRLPLSRFASTNLTWREGHNLRVWFPRQLNLATVFETPLTWRNITHASKRPDEP